MLCLWRAHFERPMGSEVSRTAETKSATIFFVERNIRGAWVIYGSEGVKQYYGYTKARALELYRASGRSFVNESGGVKR